MGMRIILTAIIVNFGLTSVQPNNSTGTKSNQRVHFCAYLIGEHITLMEKIMSNAGLRAEGFQKFWKNKDRETEKKNLLALDQFDQKVKDRVRHFFTRSQAAIRKCFDTPSFHEEMDPVSIMEINKLRDVLAADAKTFFLEELPKYLYKLITDWGALNTTAYGKTSPATRPSGTVPPEWRFNTTSAS